MTTRPPAPRQWFRLPSVVRGPAPPTAPAPQPPAPQPRPPMVRAPLRPMGMPPPPPQESTPEPPPANGVSSVPTSPTKRASVPSSPATTIVPATTSPPKPQVSAPPPASPPTSPPKLALPTFLAPASPPKPEPAWTITTRMPSPTPKPADKTPPPQSPYNKPTAPPPSPLIPPPATAQLKSKPKLEPMIPPETEQKTVLVQTTSEKPKSWLFGTGKLKDFEETHKHSSYAHHGNHEVHKDVAKKERVHRQKFSSDSDDVGMRIITISGDNKGAVMELTKSPSKSKHSFEGNSYTLRKTESDGTGRKSSSSSSSDEVKSKKDKNHKAKAMHSPPMSVFMNSNVQGINNSIVFHSSSSDHDPGVHISLSRNPSGNGFHVKDKSNGGRHEQFAKEEN